MRISQLIRTYLLPSLLLAAVTVSCTPPAAQAQTTYRSQVNPGFTTTRTTLSTTAALVLAAGRDYVARSVCNMDATIIIYIGKAGVTSANGYPVYPKTCTPPDLIGNTTAAIYAVAASGTPSAAGLQY